MINKSSLNFWFNRNSWNNVGSLHFLHVSKACRCAGASLFFCFFPNYQQPCVTHIPGLSPFCSLPPHTATQPGSCSHQPTYSFIQKGIKKSWWTGKWAFSYARVSSLIKCFHEKIVKCSLCDKRWVMMCVCSTVHEGQRSQRNHWICDKTSGDLTYTWQMCCAKLTTGWLASFHSVFLFL